MAGSRKTRRTDVTVNRPLDVSLSSWSLGLHSPVLRRPIRPLALRHADFEDKYDFHTVFYDCFWSADGKELRLIGPPLQNLADDLGMRIYAMPSGEQLTPVADSRAFIAGLRIRAPSTLHYLRIESAAGTAFVAPQPNLSSLFAGRRVVMTLSQNNELEWIRDWIIHHQRQHGCDAALVYDNNSTRYDISELKGCLASIPGITGLAVNWPFRYGPFDGRHPLTYELWEGHFCQFGMLEHARYRFLTTASCALNLDIDELVTCASGESICELTEKSSTGHLKFGGKWVETFRSSRTDPASKPLHRDFWHRSSARTQGCETKYAVVPSRVPDFAQFAVHDIYRHADSELQPGIELRHFKALNTNWTVDRPDRLQERTSAKATPAGLAPDKPLAALLKSTFKGVPRLQPAFAAASPDTAVYQSRQKSAQLLRAGRLAEAEAEAARNIATARDWPSLHLHHAILLERKGDTEGAKAERDEARRLQEAFGVTNYELGRYNMHTGHYAVAARLLHRAIRLTPDFAASYLALGKLYWMSGRHRTGDRIIRLGLERVPDSVLLNQAEADILYSTGRPALAIGYVDRALAASPHNGQLLVLRSRILRALRRLPEARATAEAAVSLQSDPAFCIEQIVAAIDHPFEVHYPDADVMTAQLELVQCLMATEELAAALDVARQASEAFPNRPYPHESCFLVLQQMGDDRAARRHLDEAIRLARRDLMNFPPQTLGRQKEQEWYEMRLNYLWYLLHCAGRSEESTEILAQALQYYPDSYITALRLIYQLSSEDRIDEALIQTEKSISSFPRNPEIIIERGRLLERKGDNKGAIEAFRAAIRLGARYAWLMSHVAHLLIQGGELVEAHALLDEALALDANHALSHYRLGEILWKGANPRAAIDAWRRAVNLAPGEAWLWSHLGGQLVEIGEFAEAEDALHRAEHLNPGDMLTHFRLGRLAEERGETEQALLWHAKAVASPETPAWLWRHYGELLRSLGKTEEAASALELSERR